MYNQSSINMFQYPVAHSPATPTFQRIQGIPPQQAQAASQPSPATLAFQRAQGIPLQHAHAASQPSIVSPRGAKQFAPARQLAHTQNIATPLSTRAAQNSFAEFAQNSFAQFAPDAAASPAKPAGCKSLAQSASAATATVATAAATSPSTRAVQNSFAQSAHNAAASPAQPAEYKSLAPSAAVAIAAATSPSTRAAQNSFAQFAPAAAASRSAFAAAAQPLTPTASSSSPLPGMAKQPRSSGHTPPADAAALANLQHKPARGAQSPAREEQSPARGTQSPANGAQSPASGTQSPIVNDPHSEIHRLQGIINDLRRSQSKPADYNSRAQSAPTAAAPPSPPTMLSSQPLSSGWNPTALASLQQKPAAAVMQSPRIPDPHIKDPKINDLHRSNDLQIKPPQAAHAQSSLQSASSLQTAQPFPSSVQASFPQQFSTQVPMPTTHPSVLPFSFSPFAYPVSSPQATQPLSFAAQQFAPATPFSFPQQYAWPSMSFPDPFPYLPAASPFTYPFASPQALVNPYETMILQAIMKEVDQRFQAFTTAFNTQLQAAQTTIDHALQQTKHGTQSATMPSPTQLQQTKHGMQSAIAPSPTQLQQTKHGMLSAIAPPTTQAVQTNVSSFVTPSLTVFNDQHIDAQAHADQLPCNLIPIDEPATQQHIEAVFNQPDSNIIAAVDTVVNQPDPNITATANTIFNQPPIELNPNVARTQQELSTWLACINIIKPLCNLLTDQLLIDFNSPLGLNSTQRPCTRLENLAHQPTLSGLLIQSRNFDRGKDHHGLSVQSCNFDRGKTHDGLPTQSSIFDRGKDCHFSYHTVTAIIIAVYLIRGEC